MVVQQGTVSRQTLRFMLFATLLPWSWLAFAQEDRPSPATITDSPAVAKMALLLKATCEEETATRNIGSTVDCGCIANEFATTRIVLLEEEKAEVGRLVRFNKKRAEILEKQPERIRLHALSLERDLARLESDEYRAVFHTEVDAHVIARPGEPVSPKAIPRTIYPDYLRKLAGKCRDSESLAKAKKLECTRNAHALGVTEANKESFCSCVASEYKRLGTGVEVTSRSEIALTTQAYDACMK